MTFEKTTRFLDIFFKVLTGLVVLTIIVFFVALYSTKASRLVFSDSAVYQDGQRIDKVITAKACDETGTSCLENVLLLQGNMDLGMLVRLYLTDLSKFRTVCLDSPGGSVPITKRIMAMIRSEKLNTCLARTYTFQLKENPSFKKSHSGCESACAVAFLSGIQRISIGSDLTLNVHASGVNGTTIHTDYLYEYVYPEPSFYCLLDIIKTVPNRTMRSISSEQASMFGVFTRSLGKSGGDVLSATDELVLPNLWNLPNCRESVLRL